MRDAYAAAFREQMRVCAYVLIGGVIVTAATWQRVPRSVEESKRRQERLAQLQREAGGASSA